MKRLSYLSITIISLVTHVIPLPINTLQVHYQTLNVNPLATQAELDEGKATMLTAIAKELPTTLDTSIFKKKIADAYAILSNPTQRKKYDASLSPDLFTAAVFEHLERTGILYQHEQGILYESLNLSCNASSDEIHEACARLLDKETSQNDKSSERKLKKIAAIEALLTHPLIKKNYVTYSAHQLHNFSEKLANQRTPLVPWKSYYELFNLTEKAHGNELQKKIQQEIASINEHLKKIKTCTIPLILTLRTKRQLFESVKKLFSDQQERYSYDLFLKTLSKSFSEENAYYTLLKVYPDADTASLNAAYKRLYNEGITSLQDFKGDELSEQRYISAFRVTAYTILSNARERKSYDDWQKKRIPEKGAPQGAVSGKAPAQKTNQRPLVSSNRFVLKKGGGYQQRLSPLQARRARALSKLPGQMSQIYKPHDAKTGAEIMPTSRPAVRRHVLKKRPGSPPSSSAAKKENQTVSPQKPTLPQKSTPLPGKVARTPSPLKPSITEEIDQNSEDVTT